MASTFVLFGIPHLTAIAFALGFSIAAYRLPHTAWGRAHVDRIAVAAAVGLVGLESAKAFFWIVWQGEPWFEHLPLHLCRISSLLCAAMLILRSYRLFEVTYFWVMGGSIPAMLTPDMRDGFPSLDFLGFFLGHTLVVVSVLIAVSGFGFRPRLRSIGVTAVVTLVYMAAVALINTMLGTNYLFLSAKPAGASVYDYLGPWPWYIAGISAVGLAVCFVCYLPFATRARTLPRV